MNAQPISPQSFIKVKLSAKNLTRFFPTLFWHFKIFLVGHKVLQKILWATKKARTTFYYVIFYIYVALRTNGLNNPGIRKLNISSTMVQTTIRIEQT